MKKTILAALMLASGMANAAFDGAYDVANWTKSTAGGSIITTAAPNLVSMFSNDDQSGDEVFTDFTITALSTGTVSFTWAYLNGDVDGSGLDPFGYLLNSQFTKLTVDNDFGAQSGSSSFAVSAGDIFGFRIYATDSSLGSSYASVRGFAAPVPEPETYAMLLAGLGLMGAVARRRKQA